MDRIKKKKLRRFRIKKGIRKIVTGHPERPRLTVFRSNKEIYAQIIDDVSGKTIVASSSLKPDFDVKGKTKIEISKLVGENLAQKALEADIKTIVFDRNGYLYHGRVKALAEGARKGGLVF